ncbi:MAG: hypothetical protein AAFO94_14815, partial [Bacteroidota bacterium]
MRHYFSITLFSGFFFFGFWTDAGTTLSRWWKNSTTQAARATAASVELSASVSNETPLSGETFIYTLQYRCASTTDDCEGVVITDPLPSEVEFISLAGSAHSTSEVYNAATNTVTFTLVDPLASGTTGAVQIFVRFPNGTTPGGTIADNTATITATNAPSAASSVRATAVASDLTTVEKDYKGGPTDEYMLYTIPICNGPKNTVTNGSVNPTSITVRDTLPAGTTYVTSNAGGVYDAVNHVVTWNVPDLASGECYFPSVTLIYPSSGFSIGDLVSNTAYVDYTPFGGSPTTVSYTL